MNERLDRGILDPLLARMKAGWRPVRGEIDPAVPQIDLIDARWWGRDRLMGDRAFAGGEECAANFFFSENLGPHGHSWEYVTREMLWIDAGRRWTLCLDGFYWLLDPPVVRRDGVMGGGACFFGTRVPVHTLFANLIGGMTVAEIAESWPSVSLDDLNRTLLQARRMVEGSAMWVDEDRGGPNSYKSAIDTFLSQADTWELRRNPRESEADFAARRELLGCGGDGTVELKRIFRRIEHATLDALIEKESACISKASVRDGGLSSGAKT